MLKQLLFQLFLLPFQSNSNYKKIVKTLAFSVAFLGAFTACEEEKKDTNNSGTNGGNNSFKQELIFDGTTYTLEDGFIIDYGADSLTANFDVVLLTDGITIEYNGLGAPVGATGNGLGLYMEAWSADTVNFADGTYAVDTVNYGAAGTISYGSIDRLVGGQFLEELKWNTGSCTIAVDGKQHTFTGSGTTMNGKSFSFSFRKELDYYSDDSFKKKFRF